MEIETLILTVKHLICEVGMAAVLESVLENSTVHIFESHQTKT